MHYTMEILFNLNYNIIDRISMKRLPLLCLYASVIGLVLGLLLTDSAEDLLIIRGGT